MDNSFCKKTIILILTLFLTLYAKDNSIAITFKGNSIIDTSMLEDVIGAKRTSPLGVWRDRNTTVSSIYIPKLDEIFKLYYRKEGFYSAKIRHTQNSSGIHFFIEENRYIKVKNIEINSDFNIENLIYLKKNRRFRAELFSKTKLNIKKKLLQKGYCNYNLNTKAFIDLKKYSADIKINLKKGSVCHFGEIDIEGKGDIDREVILSRLKFKPKDRFDITKIKDSYSDLYGLEAFEQVHIKEESRELDKRELEKRYLSLYKLKNFDKLYNNSSTRLERNSVPMSIKYREIEDNIHSRVGIGYATDLRFQAKYHWEYKNFYGNGRKLLFDVLYSKKRKRVENNFFNPAVMMLWDYHLDFQNSVGYKEERDIHNFDEKVAYDKVYLLHQDSNWFNSMGVGVENRDLSNDRSFFLIYPFIKIVYDLRDSKINPKEGLYFSHEMEYGLPYSDSSTIYLKYIDEVRAIYTIKNITLSTVGRVGAIEVYQNRLPESKKFFAGGAFSNRAYGYEQIGIITSTDKTLSDSGGYNMANLSIEANFPIYKNLSLGLFSDNTMIGSQQGVWEFSDNIIYSAGFGFRYMTPIGPFKLDFGFNTHKYSQNAIHFQIGQSF